ncbi:MAG: carboxypeptidase-like regulatory domain-containing protein [Aeromicrobium sp.]
MTSFVVAVCLVLGPLAFSPAQAAEVGSISGTVVDSSGAPIESASILVRPADDDNAQPITTDAPDGSFTVPDLPVGDYTVEIRDVSGEHLTEFYDDALTLADAATVPVTATAPTALGTITLDRAATLSGVVTDADGVAVSNASVFALPVVGGQVDTKNIVSITTDSNGAYSVAPLRAGTYKVKYTAAGYFDAYSGGRSTLQDAEQITLTTGQKDALGTTVLEATAGIRGTVRSSTGAPLARISVTAHAVVNGVAAAGSSAAGGSNTAGAFSLGGLHAGTYRLKFSDSAHAYKDRFDTTMTIEGGETADSDVITLTRVVPPAPPAVVKKYASVKVSAKGAKKKATLTITVKASGVTPTGKVTIKLGSKTLKTVRLKHGKVKVTLKKQKKGKRRYKVVYSGDSKVRAKTVTSKKVKIR